MAHSKPALVIDTSGTMCAVAIVSAPKSTASNKRNVLAGQSADIGRGHAEALPDMVSACLKDVSLSAKDIAAVFCTTGPGTFNGVRVGLSFARAFALGCGIAALGITNLEIKAAMAFSLLSDDETDALSVLCDVKRGEICLQNFQSGAVPASSPVTLAAKEITPRHLEKVICGDAVYLLDAEQVEGRKSVELSGQISMEVLGQLGFAKLAQESSKLVRPAPFYARAADAKVQSGFAVERNGS